MTTTNSEPTTTVTSNEVVITVNSDGLLVGQATTDKIAFHGSTPAVQRAGATQAAVATTAATNSTPYGYSQAQADGIVALLNEMRATLVEKGLMKGAA